MRRCRLPRSLDPASPNTVLLTANRTDVAIRAWFPFLRMPNHAESRNDDPDDYQAYDRHSSPLSSLLLNLRKPACCSHSARRAHVVLEVAHCRHIRRGGVDPRDRCLDRTRPRAPRAFSNKSITRLFYAMSITSELTGSRSGLPHYYGCLLGHQHDATFGASMKEPRAC